MQVQLDIGFEQLVKIVKALPKGQLLQLKKEIESTVSPSGNNDLRSFLINGPVFSEDQLTEISATRKAINKWRTK